MYKIRVVCCDCGQDLGFKDGGSKPGMVSHTYCEVCGRRVLDELGSIKKVIEREDQKNE